MRIIPSSTPLFSKIGAFLRNNYLLLGILFIYFVFAFYNINHLPAEWFGDISYLNDYVLKVIHGKWPFDFTLSEGPLYFYLISPLVLLFGSSYLVYKCISASIGFIGLLAIYLFAKELSSKRVALLTAFITAVSFWYIVWARLGNVHILLPLITSLMMYFFIHYIKTKQLLSLLFSFFCASLGLFTYAGAFILPIVLFLLFLYATSRKEIIPLSHTVSLFGVIIPTVLLFSLAVFFSLNDFTSGYLGMKLSNLQNLSLKDDFSQLISNSIRTLGMLHIQGDMVFRWNVPYTPQLERVSGLFFFVGICYSFLTNKKYFPYLIIPLLLIPIPSILPGQPSIEIPSSSRTIAIIPFVFLLVAYGIDAAYQLIRKVNSKVALLFLGDILFMILLLNAVKYFLGYPFYLPVNNQPTQQLIATYVTSLPPDTHVYLSYVRWPYGEDALNDGIYYSLPPGNRKAFSSDSFVIDCSDLPKKKKIAVIISPYSTAEQNQFRDCLPTAMSTMHKNNKVPAFFSVYQP